MLSDILDYRNGKYQGPTTINHQRHGLGIFIDDDLAFYISHWKSNKLNGPTLIYLTHGKYIYGEWKNNQPNGLNIYRSGDTVLLANFQDGIPVQRCLLIFQRENFACIINQTSEENWQVSSSGKINSHSLLLSFISKMEFSVPDHYFSLTKFASSLSQRNKAVKMFPCLNNHCYFGFVNGLGIIFNSNNGVVSVGCHRKQTLCEFGGRFEGLNSAQQGNFEPQGERIKYRRLRPAAKIYNIFQNLHKKGLNFFNEYFDSRSKIFSHIQQLLRGKLKEIAEQGMKTQNFAGCIEDSLDFRQYNEEESIKVYENRQRMYSPPKKNTNFERSPSRQYSNGPYRSPLSYKDSNTSSRMTSVKKTQQNNPISCSKQLRKRNEDINSTLNSPYYQQAIQNVNRSTQKVESNVMGQLKLLSDFSRKVYLEKNSQFMQSNSRDKQQYDSNLKSPTFKALLQEMDQKYRQKPSIIVEKNEQPIRPESRQMSPSLTRTKSSDRKSIARPSYEEIEDRRKRVLKEFQKMNVHNNASEHSSKQSKESAFGYIPLSISNRINQKSMTPKKNSKLEDQVEPSPSFKRKKENAENIQSLKGREYYKRQEKVQRKPLNYFKRLQQDNEGTEQSINIQKSEIDHHQMLTSKSTSNVSPSRQKKTYVYLFE